MVKIDRVGNLVRQFRNLQKEAAKGDDTVTVGYVQNYAVYVHENLESYHRVGQAKYLEQPARTMRGELVRIVKSVYLKTKSLSKALLLAGLRLQRESQKLVPVDTSALKASAFTALKKDEESAALDAFEKGVAKKEAAKKRRKGRRGRG